jgi:hypothetical protein
MIASTDTGNQHYLKLLLVKQVLLVGNGDSVYLELVQVLSSKSFPVLP